ncbi:hypothetical protein [Enterovirga sp.]|uniref:hypothetical protein n=1 Tax=Enterovirga sp. TaxID=2026350 RepID=UPI00261F0520|nr:hypothetical protein [Enterovirga sp.]MDB5591872.1 hypothetical protein [Enterovirga sp.]
MPASSSAPAALATSPPLPGLAGGGFGRSLVPSLVDQGLTSLQSFSMAVALIKLTGPAVFGQFVFVFTLVMIVASFQNALTGIPLLVHVAAWSGEARRAGLATVLAADRRCRAAAALLVAAAATAVTADPVAILAAGLFCLAHLSRETARNILFASGAGDRAAALSAVTFAVFAPVFAGGIWAGFPLAAPFAAAAAGIFTALAVIRVPGAARRDRAPGVRQLAAAYRRAFPGLGWRLAQSASNEAQTRSHVFALTAWRGVDQVGLLEAGRVLWAPLVVLYQTWQKVAQPRLAALVARGETRAALHLTLGSVGALGVAAALYAAALLSLWAPLSTALFSSFADIRPFAVGWLVYTVLLLANWMLIALLNAQRRFRTVALAGGVSAGLTALGLVALVLPVPLGTALGVLIAVQAVMLLGFCAILVRAPGAKEAQP